MKLLRRFWMLCIFFCCTRVSASAQNLSPSPYIIAFEMGVTNVYEITSTVGYTNQPAQQHRLYRQLLKTAQWAELVDLATNHNSAVVRLYAYQGLRQKGMVIPEALQQKMIADKTPVAAVSGCMQFNSTVQGLLNKEIETKILFATQLKSQPDF